MLFVQFAWFRPLSSMCSLFNNCELRFFMPNINLSNWYALVHYIDTVCWIGWMTAAIQQTQSTVRKKSHPPTVMWSGLKSSPANFRWIECLEPIQSEFKCKMQREKRVICSCSGYMYTCNSIFIAMMEFYELRFTGNLCMALYLLSFLSA